MNLRKILTDNYIQKKYIRSGIAFGEAVSYIFLGESPEFETLLDMWERWEQEYSRRGYRTLSLDTFIKIGGYDGPLDPNLLGKKLGKEEKPVLHSKIYREKFLGKIPPVVDIGELKKGGIQVGKYLVPSTEK